MTQYTGQITVIIDADNECTAEATLRAIAQSIEDESDAVIFADHNGDVENYEELEAECQKSLESGPPSPTRFDDYEIQPCRRFEEPDSPGRFYFESCNADDADVWTLYGHIPGQGGEAIGDFDTLQHAEEVFARITGRRYADNNTSKTSKP
jgi:hypothetical protein